MARERFGGLYVATVGLRLLFAGGVLALACRFVWTGTFRAGIDFEGGTELVYELPIDPVTGERGRAEDVAQCCKVFRERIETSEIAWNPSVEALDNRRIRVRVPVRDEKEAREVDALLRSLGKLEFRLVAGRRTGDKGTPIDYSEEDAEWRVFEGLSSKARDDMARHQYEISLASKGAHHGERRRGYQWYAVEKPDRGRPPWRLIVLWEKDEDGNKIRFPVFEGGQLDEVGLNRIPDLRPTFEFREEYKSDFARFTGMHVGEPLAILYDDVEVSDPVIDEKLPGQGEITGLSRDLALRIVTVLRSGRLSVRPKLVSQDRIEPVIQLGTLTSGPYVGGAALLVVAIALLVAYRVPGLPALASLATTLTGLAGGAAKAGAALSAASVAGVLLAVGLNLHASALLLDRIRAVCRRGKGIDVAQPIGFLMALVAAVVSHAPAIAAGLALHFLARDGLRDAGEALFLGASGSLFALVFVMDPLCVALRKIGVLRGPARTEPEKPGPGLLPGLRHILPIALVLAAAVIAIGSGQAVLWAAIGLVVLSLGAAEAASRYLDRTATGSAESIQPPPSTTSPS
ncbi:MAG: hypothetical protein HY720_33350 [Planctomycetes bacterium]|nr:hypothetical protein [Planctomycetota bacterium]